jgi:FixJ family two-component response regulator
MSKTNHPPRPKGASCILLLEDDAGTRRSLHLLLRGRGFEVRSYAAAGPLLEDPAARAAPYLIADYRLAETDGVAVLRTLRKQGWAGRAVLITGFSSDALRKEALAAGYVAVLDKPVLPHMLLTAITGNPHGGA